MQTGHLKIVHLNIINRSIRLNDYEGNKIKKTAVILKDANTIL